MHNPITHYIYDNPPWLIEDMKTYYMVYYDYKHIASFKTAQLAIDYVMMI